MEVKALCVIQDTVVVSVRKLLPVVAYNDSREIGLRLEETLYGCRRDTVVEYRRDIQRLLQATYRVVVAAHVKKYLSLAQLAELDHVLDLVEFQARSAESVEIVLLQVIHHTTGSDVIKRLSVQQGEHYVRL